MAGREIEDEKENQGRKNRNYKDGTLTGLAEEAAAVERGKESSNGVPSNG